MAAAVAASLFLGLDVGTQGTKGVALDRTSGRIIARSSHPYGLIPGLGPGAAEQHPEQWIDAVCAVTRDLVAAGAAPEAVHGIGVSGQQHGAVVLDGEGRVVRPAKLWCDTTAAAEAARLSATLGRAIPAGFTAPKLVWIRDHEPELWARVATVLLPHDYVNFRLTGQKVMEAGDASGTGLFDPASRAFDPKAVAAVDARLAAMLPPVISSSAQAGRLSAEGAALLGLRAGTLVSSGGGDNMMSAIGSGATRPGIVVVSLGTSGTVFCYSETPVIDPEGLIAPFCDSTGAYLPLLCTMNVTSVTEEVRTAFPGHDLRALDEAASAVPPGSDGLLFLPYLRGERVPDLPHATGAILGVVPGVLTAGHLFRAAMEGTTLALASGIERMKRLGVTLDAVRVVGGGSKSALWRQILSDALGVPVVGLAEPESGALGAAVQALWAARVAGGERVTADEVASEYVHPAGPPCEPNGAVFHVYEGLRQRLEASTAKLFS
jgi:xylulokinase